MGRRVTFEPDMEPAAGGRRSCTRLAANAKARGMKKVPKSPPAAPAWSGQNGYVRMMIRDLVTEVRLGLHPWERHPEKPQRIVINVEMYAAPQEARAKGVSSVVDYDYVRNALRKWPRRKHTVFIESLLDELVKLCFRDKR